MKRILYILLSLTFLTSCAKEYLIDSPQTVEEGKVLVSFNVQLDGDMRTKALGDTPAINSLHLAVFDPIGYLSEYVEATAVTLTSDPTSAVPKYQYTYTAELSESKGERYIHFIVNGPAELEFGEETALIASLSTDMNSDGAYWQRIHVNEIRKSTYSNTDNFGQTISLIRNFSKIEVTTTDNNFKIISYMLVNQSSMGSIAAYNKGAGKFQTDYLTAGTVAAVSTLDGYKAVMPKSATILRDLDENKLQAVDYDTDPANPVYPQVYMYECTQVGDPMKDPYILVKGKFRTSDTQSFDDITPTYYKIRLTGADDQVFDIYRNFYYRVNISQVMRAGFPSIFDADASQGMGDLSFAARQDGLSNISDGTSRLLVSDTSIILVDDSPFYFSYKYLPDMANHPDDPANNLVEIEIDNYVIEKDGTRRELADEDKILTNLSQLAPQGDNTSGDKYRVYTITPNAMRTDNKERHQTITLKTYKDADHKEAAALSRVVDIYQRPKLEMVLEPIPTAVSSDASGQPLTLKVSIPGNLTDPKYFPLDFYFEAENQSLAPNQETGEYMPVKTGVSVATDGKMVGKNTYGFVKTITKEQYDGIETKENLSGDPIKSFTCDFVTTKAGSESRIWGQNKYFTLANTEFGNYQIKKFTNLKYVNNSGTTVTTGSANADLTFNFYINFTDDNPFPSNTPIEVHLTNLDPGDGLVQSADGKYFLYYPTSGSHDGSFGIHIPETGTTGSVELRCWQYENNSASISIVAPVITLDKQYFTLRYGGASKLTATTNTSSAIKFTSSDPSLVSVDANSGNLTSSFGRSGVVTITASLVNYPNIKATCQVVVIKKSQTPYWTKATNVGDLVGKTVVIVKDNYIAKNSSLGMDSKTFDQYVLGYESYTYTVSVENNNYVFTGANGNRLRVNNSGTLGLNTNSRYQWTLNYNANGFTIRNVTLNSYYLHTNGSGSFDASTSATRFQIWYRNGTAEDVYNKVYTIKQSAYSKYIYVNDNEILALSANGTTPSYQHHWVAINDNNKLYIQNVETGLYFADDARGEDISTSSSFSAATPLEVNPVNGFFEINVAGKNLQVNNWGGVTQANTSLGLFEKENGIQLYQFDPVPDYQ